MVGVMKIILITLIPFSPSRRLKEKNGGSMKNPIFTMLAGLSLLVICVGCAGYQVVPERLQGQINHELTFTQLRENPEVYKGELVVVGGEVLSIDRRQDQTRIEVLQLPLSDDFLPANRRTKTQGRFVALSGGKDPLDPAILQPGVAITIVGEIIGSTTIQIDNDEKQGPIFGIKDLTIWDEQHYWGRPYYGNWWDWGYRGPYSGYRPFGYPYY
jgi:outer membrane lipoprotein